jgi:hypothetical protein
MNISSIQKRKFLGNIYKILYSQGKKPSELEIKKVFGEYFSIYKFGNPIPLDYTKLDIVAKTDVNLINELMANTLFNVEVLYDCVNENNQEIFSIVTALNNRLDNLKSKRKILENKIDDLIFANSNSDGYFYSYLEGFSNLDTIDMDMTSAYIDTLYGNVSIPKITNSISNALTTSTITSSNATYSIMSNNQPVVNNVDVQDFESVFDGLNDTYWSYTHNSPEPSVVVMTLNIPINTSYNLSKISGSLLTSAPCAIYVTATPTDTNKPEQMRSQTSKTDYNRFSFTIPADFYSKIMIIIYKTEPDQIENNSINPYTYKFGIRELVINADYYDKSAVIVSAPISIPVSDNNKLTINSVSIETKDQILSGTDIKYYVAADTTSAKQIAEFNWIPIEPTSSTNATAQKIVNLSGSSVQSRYIGVPGEDSSSIPINPNPENVNEANPTTLPGTDKEVYRIEAVNASDQFIDPYILADLNCYKHYHITPGNSNVEYYKSLNIWTEKIAINDVNELNTDIVKDQISNIAPGIYGVRVGLMETKLLTTKEYKVSHKVTKSRDDFNLAIYLNGNLIADLPSGVISSTIEWNFITGINNIVVTYDKNFSGLINFDLMSNKNLIDYGTMFLNYFSYLDPMEFKRRSDISANLFTIAPFYTRREILSSREISGKSLLNYYSNALDTVTAVRYRADLIRYENPLQTPLIDSIRVKFKHNDS